MRRLRYEGAGVTAGRPLEARSSMGVGHVVPVAELPAALHDRPCIQHDASIKARQRAARDEEEPVVKLVAPAEEPYAWIWPIAGHPAQVYFR